MKRIAVLAIAMAMCAIVADVQAQALTGRDVAQRVKDRPDGDTRQSEVVMTLINKRGSKRERKIQSYSIDVGEGKRDRKSIMFFLYPGDVKGTGFLTWDYDQVGREDDRWLYLPAMKKTRRISGSSAKTDYFMGSDFTYDDMGSRNVDEDTHKLLGEEERNGHKCWKLESTPKDSHEIYSKRIAWVRQDCLIAEHVEYYDRAGKLHRTLEVSDIVQQGNYWVARKMHMTNVQTGHQTLIEMKNMRFDEKMDEKQFTVTSLERGSL